MNVASIENYDSSLTNKGTLGRKKNDTHPQRPLESKRVAFYRPVSSGLTLMNPCIEEPIEEEPERRSSSPYKHNGRPDSAERRNSAESVDPVNDMNNSLESLNIGSSTNSMGQVFDFHQMDREEDDDNCSIATYNTVDTSATNESVQSIISRLQSETDRRRRRLRRRRYARSGTKPMTPIKPEDPIKGITVEIKE